MSHKLPSLFVKRQRQPIFFVYSVNWKNKIIIEIVTLVICTAATHAQFKRFRIKIKDYFEKNTRTNKYSLGKLDNEFKNMQLQKPDRICQIALKRKLCNCFKINWII